MNAQPQPQAGPSSIRPPLPPPRMPPPASAYKAPNGANGGAGPSQPPAMPAARPPPSSSVPARHSPLAPPLKRESTDDGKTTDDEGHDDDDSTGAGSGSGDAASKQSKKKAPKKKKANRACAACQKAHLTCDDDRPCSRCVKKGIGDQCTDGKRKRAKYLLDEDELEAVKAREQADKEAKERAATANGHQTQAQGPSAGIAAATSSNSPTLTGSGFQPPPPPVPPYVVAGAATQQQQSQDVPAPTSSSAPASNSQAASQTTPPYTFGSEATSLEYSMLSAMLNGIDPSLLSGSPDIEGGSAGPSNVGGGGYSMLTPGGAASGDGLDLSGFLGQQQQQRTNLPSVGMASDPSAFWLSNGGQGGQVSWMGDSSAAAPLPVQSNTAAIGQLHAIGGQDTSAAEGEVGSGGFKALEVPSPAASIISSASRLGGRGEDGASPSDAPHPLPPSNNGPGSSSTAPHPQHPQTAASAASAAAAAAASAASSHPGGSTDLFKSQFRDRVTHIYGDRTRPFPYTEGYHFLLKYVTEKFEKAEVLRIVRALGLFRPSLIALQMPLTEEDEVFVERSIQRTILEFEKLISFSGTPTVVWRRTCEICVVGSEFSMLTGWTREALLGRRIYEFWDKDSTLEYWEKFASHAFENTSQSIVANVVVKRPDGSSVPCAACFSIKRNVFDLPSLVVGAFLPILSST